MEAWGDLLEVWEIQLFMEDYHPERAGADRGVRLSQVGCGGGGTQRRGRHRPIQLGLRPLWLFDMIRLWRCRVLLGALFWLCQTLLRFGTAKRKLSDVGLGVV